MAERHRFSPIATEGVWFIDALGCYFPELGISSIARPFPLTKLNFIRDRITFKKLK